MEDSDPPAAPPTTAEAAAAPQDVDMTSTSNEQIDSTPPVAAVDTTNTNPNTQKPAATSSATDAHADADSTMPSEFELLRASQLRKEVEHEQALVDERVRVAELERLLKQEKEQLSASKATQEGLGQSFVSMICPSVGGTALFEATFLLMDLSPSRHLPSSSLPGTSPDRPRGASAVAHLAALQGKRARDERDLARGAQPRLARLRPDLSGGTGSSLR